MRERELELRTAYPGYFGARLDVEVPDDGLPEEFWVITACDPDGVVMEPEVNERRTLDFRSELLEAGLMFFPVTGYDPEGSHREPGFGIVTGEEDALEAGRRLEQIAVYQVTEGGVWLVFCGEPPERFFVRPWEEMIRV